MPTYEEAVRYLNSLIDYEKQAPGKYDTRAYNLDAFRVLLDRLGNPHEALSAIHVAGTDGKGSTCAFAESLLRAAGLTTGFYSSPHLASYAERISLNGIPISGERFAELVAEVRAASETDPPVQRSPERSGFATVFEILTAMAFVAFSRARVEAAVVEVGLGGRLDATNVIAPRLSVIAPVDRDHTALLGPTPAAIAREKGGIIKPGVPVVLSPQQGEVIPVLIELAADRASPVIRSDEVYAIRDIIPSPRECRFSLQGAQRGFRDLRVPLAGRHQLVNARTALVAVEEFLKGIGRTLTEDEIRTGLARTYWPGRFEAVVLGGAGTEPVHAVLDCAHTPQAGRALRSTLEELHPGEDFVFLVGLSTDKQIEDFLRALLRPGDIVITTRSDSPRAMEPKKLARLAEKVLAGSTPGATPRVRSTPDCDAGIALAARTAHETGRLLCVTGSVYLIGLVRSRAAIVQTP